MRAGVKQRQRWPVPFLAPPHLCHSRRPPASTSAMRPAGVASPGLLKVCKVAGPGIAVGTPFTFTAGSSTFTVPAGPAPGGTCVIGPSFPVGSNVTVAEDVPPGYTVSSIAVAPPKRLVGTPNLAGGSVNVTIGTGVTEVTFTDKRTGFLEICKKRRVRGNFNFTVNPGGLGPFVVPAGACSPAIEVSPAGRRRNSRPPARDVDCATFPAGQQGACDPDAQTSTVTVVARRHLDHDHRLHHQPAEIDPSRGPVLRSGHYRARASASVSGLLFWCAVVPRRVEKVIKPW